jgi:EAL and modified HD-GYP domain-containing signal transduction protein
MLAEKVETQADFTEARDRGFVYFQGYFFRRPEMLNTRDMPANRLQCLRMLREVSRPDVDIIGLETLIKSEAAICYRLLRYLNSSIFGLKSEIHSVRHALSMLGEREVRRWVRLVAAVGAGEEKPSDLVLAALVRGRFGELLSPRVPHGDSDLFLMGLLSLLDAMLEMPMAEVLERVPLDLETKAVLLGQASLLRPVYQLMLAHESGEWEAVGQLCQNLKLQSEDVAGLYWQAQQWARDVSSGTQKTS